MNKLLAQKITDISSTNNEGIVLSEFGTCCCKNLHSSCYFLINICMIQKCHGLFTVSRILIPKSLHFSNYFFKKKYCSISGLSHPLFVQDPNLLLNMKFPNPRPLTASSPFISTSIKSFSHCYWSYLPGIDSSMSTNPLIFLIKVLCDVCSTCAVCFICYGFM